MKIINIFEVQFLRKIGIQAITLYPFVLYAEKRESIGPRLLRHELEHVYQIQKAGFFRFYFSYLVFYFRLRRKGLNHHQAYLEIPYEVEARQKESSRLTSSDMATLGLPDLPKDF